MLEKSRRRLLVAVLLLCIAGMGLAAYGYFWVVSTPVHVDMQYAVTLSVSVSDSSVTLDAAVTNGVNPVRAGINVDFYYSLNGGLDWTYFATQLTDTSGAAQATYTAIANGSYDFKAVAYIP